jgi:DNA-binding SARP family transcriptional activator
VGRPVHRTWVCSVLWPDIPARSAAARLRTTLWRLRPFGAEDILDVDAYTLGLAADVHVDWRHALDLCDRVLSGRAAPSHTVLRDELLPLLRAGALLDGWTDEWHVHERNRFHVIRLSTLGRLSACAAAH